jgi:hypothetical protein
MVAVFPLPGRGESYVSVEKCADPILADAPVITNVSVMRTGQDDGEVLIKWHPPFDLDPGQFPGERQYVVQRSESLGGPFLSDLVHTGRLSDTLVIDGGINTEDRIFYYRVLLYVPDVSDQLPIDTSAIASTVRLELKPQTGMIDLSWGAFVPWSNQIQTSPNHVIYRGDEGAVVNADLEAYDSVNVFVNGMLYSDNGKDGPPLNDNTIYCYQVVTRGGYGNTPTIKQPLINYSQIICAQPKDSIPPCMPTLVVDATDCEEFVKQSCDFSEFENTVRWARLEDECADDVSYYRVYASATKNGEYNLLKDNVRDTFYIDKNLGSYARCYRISAVDRSGNESELSEPTCNENCPYYELPNIFTPNGDTYNDFFSAFSTRGWDPGCESCPPEDLEQFEYLTERCARFVQRVKLNVFNRWGKEVYTFESGGENTIYIDWDGRDKNGSELATGVYYYSAEVTFYAADPNKRVKVFKGWVHLVR